MFLIVFDFDHTIIEENSDLHVKQLFPTDDDRRRAEEDSSTLSLWTDRMQLIFRHLHRAKIQPKDYRENMNEMRLTEGFAQLIEFLRTMPNTRLIIISDSNSIFIETILQHHRLDQHFHDIFTNPAFFDSETGCLNIQPYGQQTCSTCPSNMCKREILQGYVQSEPWKIIFIGDGHNDVCAAKDLKEGDLVCARRGYRMAKELKELPPLKAKLIEWNNGNEIETFLREKWFH